jgi:hypothetical protein
LLEEAALRSKGICSGFYHPMSAPAILYVGYGLPIKVSYYGSQPLYTLLSSSSQDSRLSIESEIRSFHRTNLHRSSLSTSFFFTSDVALLRVCQLSVQHTPVVELLLIFIFNFPLDTRWDRPISISRPGCHSRPTVPPHL